MQLQEERCDWRQDANEDKMQEDRCDWRRKETIKKQDAAAKIKKMALKETKMCFEVKRCNWKKAWKN